VVLDEHGHEVGHDEYPHQEVAVVGAGADVGGYVAGVDVSHCSNEGGAGEAD